MARREEMRQAHADDAAYAEAQRVDTAVAYGEYLAAYPRGQHADEARAREAVLRNEEQQASEAAVEHPLDTREERLHLCFAQVERITEGCKANVEDPAMSIFGTLLAPGLWTYQLLIPGVDTCSGTPIRMTHGFCDTEAACMKKRCERDQDPLGYATSP